MNKKCKRFGRFGALTGRPGDFMKNSREKTPGKKYWVNSTDNGEIGCLSQKSNLIEHESNQTAAANR